MLNYLGYFLTNNDKGRQHVKNQIAKSPKVVMMKHQPEFNEGQLEGKNKNIQ